MCLNNLVKVSEGISYLCRYRNGTIIKKDFSDDIFWDCIKTVEIVKMKYNAEDRIMEVWLDIDIDNIHACTAAVSKFVRTILNEEY